MLYFHIIIFIHFIFIIYFRYFIIFNIFIHSVYLFAFYIFSSFHFITDRVFNHFIVTECTAYSSDTHGSQPQILFGSYTWLLLMPVSSSLSSASSSSCLPPGCHTACLLLLLTASLSSFSSVFQYFTSIISFTIITDISQLVFIFFFFFLPFQLHYFRTGSYYLSLSHTHTHTVWNILPHSFNSSSTDIHVIFHTVMTIRVVIFHIVSTRLIIFQPILRLASYSEKVVQALQSPHSTGHSHTHLSLFLIAWHLLFLAPHPPFSSVCLGHLAAWDSLSSQLPPFWIVLVITGLRAHVSFHAYTMFSWLIHSYCHFVSSYLFSSSIFMPLHLHVSL